MKNPYEEQPSPLKNPYLSDSEDKSDFHDGFGQFVDDENISDNPHSALQNPQAELPPVQQNADTNIPFPQQNTDTNIPFPQQNVDTNIPFPHSDAVQNTSENPYNRNYSKNPYYKQYQHYQNTSSQEISPPIPYAVKRIFDRTDRIFASLSIVIGLFFVWFIFVQDFNFGIGATVCFTTTLFLSYAYITKKNIEIDILHKIVFGILALLCIPFTLYDSTMALTMNFFTLLFGTLYWTYSAGGNQRKKSVNYLYDVCMGCIAYPFMNYGAMYPAIFRKNHDKKNSNAKWIILGLIIAIPVVAVISALLMASDEMFKAMFSVFFDDFLSKILKYILYAILGLPIAMFFFSEWYSKYTEDQKQLHSVYNRPVHRTDSHVVPLALVYSVVIPMCVVYFMYLIAQVSYFISFIAKNLLPKNFTIVDYARRGFFELCVIAVINLVVIVLIITFSRQHEGKTAKGINTIVVIMSVFTIIFIATAIYKMSMYIKTYGYTPMRIDTALFMIFLFVVFVMIIIRQLVGKISLFKCTIMILLLFLGVFNIMNVDAFVAKENIRLYQEGKIDWMGTALVNNLDNSAYEYLIPFAEDENNGLTREENRALHNAINRRKSVMKYSVNYSDMSDTFPSFNVSRYKVYDMLEDYDYAIYEKQYRDYDDYDYDNYNSYDNSYYKYGNDDL